MKIIVSFKLYVVIALDSEECKGENGTRNDVYRTKRSSEKRLTIPTASKAGPQSMKCFHIVHQSILRILMLEACITVTQRTMFPEELLQVSGRRCFNIMPI